MVRGWVGVIGYEGEHQRRLYGWVRGQEIAGLVKGWKVLIKCEGIGGNCRGYRGSRQMRVRV